MTISPHQNPISLYRQLEMLSMHNIIPSPPKVTISSFHVLILQTAWERQTTLFHALFSSNDFDKILSCYLMHVPKTLDYHFQVFQQSCVGRIWARLRMQILVILLNTKNLLTWPCFLITSTPSHPWPINRIKNKTPAIYLSCHCLKKNEFNGKCKQWSMHASLIFKKHLQLHQHNKLTTPAPSPPLSGRSVL
jgi:hypothetical protein